MVTFFDLNGEKRAERKMADSFSLFVSYAHSNRVFEQTQRHVDVALVILEVKKDRSWVEC